MSEEELISAAQNGNEEAFSEIYTKYSGVYLHVVNSHKKTLNPYQITDLFEDKFLNIWRYVKAYKPDRGAKLSTFIGLRARYECLNSMEDFKKRGIINFDEEVEPKEKDSDNSHNIFIRKELLQRVLNIIENWPDERVSQIFQMRYIDPNSNKLTPWHKIAKKVKMSVQGCINLHNRTLTQIHDQIR